MGVKEKAVDRGARRGRALLVAIGGELREARVEHGLSQTEVGAAVGLSGPYISKIERALAPSLTLRDSARLASVLGMELSCRTYPLGSPIRDRAHRALLERARSLLGSRVEWRYEVPLPTGDARAWDAAVVGAEWLGFEAETRLGDIQSLQRRVQLKLRDDPRMAGSVLLLSDTRHNRAVLREHERAIESVWPVSGRDLVSAVQAGRPVSGVLLA